MDIIQFYQDFSIDHRTEGHKHCRPGWVNIECPFCTGNPGLHLGYDLEENYFTCWRCGSHSIVEVVAKLTNLKWKGAEELVKRYGGSSNVKMATKVKTNTKPFQFPSSTGPLTQQHKNYLISRNFDADKIIHNWGLLATGAVSVLDGLSYKLRIIVPVIWERAAVSFISRDITNKSTLRYITCPIDREIIHHKSILYGKQERWKQEVVLVEGVTDVWRFGFNSCATFGIKYTNQQVRVISKLFKRVAVCYDDDPQAIIQSTKLVAELKFRGVDSFRVDIKGDPGSMKQDEADYLVKQLIK